MSHEINQAPFITGRKLRWCDYEVKESPEGIYFRDNTGQKPGDARKIDKVVFPHQGEDCAIWLIRPCEGTRLAWRSRNILDYANVLVLIDEKEGLIIDKDTRFIKPGDGIAIIRPGVRWEPGLPDIVSESPTIWEFVDTPQAVR
ncbi:MAG: hypothetical protein A2655_04875 [Candidatus Yanofskybacteria bacterium RIFCSPHIGHO2_01_FULL_43_42]|uniref:Uncharacterized protein n=1 Tax=Candidatus Yanofskybacteria bacterium RIFCSPLOWO2_01_FULL_43_22 TaxID=1802695 RepID=A0A1F8GIH1_9BACT|nr:MAG: hypothetical protein A2655_04875 [Candidatus Yanofskybacteria bacterium RIFCSPHIGHO2_01_FULL_43_42]OGN13619.1 MAG: hypothetical protein A3D48_00855 [Candidatus Yanofskybacteria bacterium RIFCSPHIGHO2_02_FULL_43_17]OGN25194.1 MAG: hypothetical protein A3A13_03885 [Candidatus Yanofskybacteria bacterium RIFCSPLOWO2_01_FULL_43_22]